MRALLTGGGGADRAGILAAIYLISYSGAALPSLIAGQLSRSVGLFDLALGYGALAALACVVTWLTAREPETHGDTAPERPVSHPHPEPAAA